MSNPMIAKRYAAALFEVAAANSLVDTIAEELSTVKEVFNSNPGLITILNNPKLGADKKKALLQSAFSGATTYVQNLLFILADRHRENSIPEVADQFIELANQAKGLAAAKVYSVSPLTEEQKEAISLAFAPKVGKTALRIENITDSNLLGGVKLRIGNRIFDGSLRGKLDRLERKLLS